MSLTCPNGHASETEDYCDTCGAKIDPGAQPTGSSGNNPVGSSPSGASTSAGPESPATSSAASEAPAELVCPHCAVNNLPGSLFCEACGYDFTTGAMPRGVETSASANSLDIFGAESTPDSASSSATPTSEPPEVPETGSSADGIPPAVPMEWVAEIWVDPDWYAVQEADEPMPSPGLPFVVPLTVSSALIGRVSNSRNIHPEIDCTTDTGVSRRHAQLTTDGSRWFVEDLGSSNGTFVGNAAGPLPEDPIPVGPKKELDADDRIYAGAWTRIVVRRATDDEKTAAGS